MLATVMCAAMVFQPLTTFAANDGTISVGLDVGSTCKYGSYSTRYYTDTTNNNSFAYCVQPSKNSPAGGTYTASVSDLPGLRAILYYGYGGPGFEDPNYGAKKIFDFSESEIAAKRLPYAYTHTLTALAYYGGNWDAMGSSIQQGMVDLKDAFSTVYEFYRDKDSIVPSGFTAYLFSTGSTQTMATWRYVPKGYLNLKKISANPALTNGNSCYSLEGAEFGVYTEHACTNQIANLKTDASGNSNTVEMDEGTYYVKENVAPKGFALSSEVKTVTVISGQTATVSFTDLPQSDPVRVVLGKIDKETNKNKPQGSASLAGAEFTVKYYDGFCDTDPAAQGKTAIRTWILRTSESGSAILADSYKISGDDFWYRTNGDVTLPLGTITIQETKAPTGYLLNDEVYVRKITSMPNTEIVNTYNQPTIPEQTIRGGVKIAKMDSEKGKSEAQGSATLGNAEFSIVTLNENPVVVEGKEYSKGQVVKTIVTDSKTKIASTASDTLPHGDYKIFESKSPYGYLKEGTLERTFSIRENGVIVDLTSSENAILNDVIRGGVKIAKRDYESKENVPLGGASLGNAQFDIITLNENTVLVEGKEYSKGQVVKTIVTDSETNIATTAADTLSHGHYKIVESGLPEGYLMQGILSQEFDITQDGVIVDLTDVDHSIQDQVKRGDFDISKIDSSSQNTMANVKFRITSNTTGESHEFTTDENGYYSSASDWNKHSSNTNGGGAEDGMWFGIDSNGNQVAVNDNLGALPYDTYTIEELPCTANEGKRLYVGTLTIKRDGVTIHMNNIENVGVTIGTTAKDAKTGTQYVCAEDDATIIDTVTMSGLENNVEYTLVGTLIDKETGLAVKDAEGRAVTSSVTFKPTTDMMYRDMEFDFDASGLAGHDVVVFEELYQGEKLAASHKDLSDEGQTVHFPGIGTKASDKNTGIDVSMADEEVTLVDTVSYTNLQPGKKYTLTGTLMDKETGEAVRDKEGNKITAKASFTPEEADGMAELEFTFDGSLFAGKTVVAFEELSRNDKVYAVHADINDEAQTVHFPKISTKVKDSDTGENASYADAEITLVDTVSYENLTPGYSYTVKGIIYDKETGEPLKINGEQVTAEAMFTPEETSGTVDVAFLFAGKELAGKTLVVFETVYYGSASGEEIVAEHKDLSDEGQTIHIPEVGTTVSDSETGINLSHADDEITVTDTVSYKNLIPGKEYKLTGVLMDKETGEAVLDKEENVITSEISFIPEEPEATVDVVFTFDGTELAGRTVVAFEELSRNDKVYAVHADISDEAQTLYIPKIGTTVTDSDTQENASCADEEITLIDTVSYEGLNPNCTYTVKGIIYDKNTKKPLMVNGEEVTAEAELTPGESFGTVDVSFTFSGKGLAGKTLVIFETVYYNNGEEEIAVAEHADINDEGQTIHIPEVGTTIKDSETGINLSHADDKIMLTDTVSFENLIPGKEYTLTGTLMDKETGKELLDKDGNIITAKSSFIPEETSGTTEVLFVFDGTGLAGKTVVAFEELSRNDKVYAVHADIEDEAQTIHFPEIHTNAVDAITQEHTGIVGEKMQLIDTVSYKNLVPGKEYTAKGILMDKSTGKEFLDASGNAVTAETIFTPEKANGSVEVVFEFTGTTAATIVVMENLYYEDNLVAEHADINEENQTVTYSILEKAKTGDKSPIEALLVIAIGAGVAIGAVLYLKKKDSREQNKKKNHGKKEE